MARAKHTGRAEARRRYRQAVSQEVDAESADLASDDADAPATGAGRTAAREPASRQASRQASRPAAQTPPARPGFGYAFRAAYHPANVREDLRALPKLLRHWSFLLPIGLIIGGAVVSTFWWNYTGGQLAFQLLVFPGSGFGVPQLAAGFFAPRASYMLGFLVSVVQGIAALLLASSISAQLGTPISSDQLPTLLGQAFLFGPVSGTLFAAAAAWYRRFLTLSSPRRPPSGGRTQSRSGSRQASARR